MMVRQPTRNGDSENPIYTTIYPKDLGEKGGNVVVELASS